MGLAFASSLKLVVREMRKLFIFVAIGALLGLLTTSPVMAADPYTYTITVPGTITLGPFIAAQAYSLTGQSITVSTDDPNQTTCGITVSDSKTASKGFLTLSGADDIAKELTNPLMVKGGDVVDYTPLTTDQILKASATLIAGTYNTDFAVSQTIASGDLTKAAGTYSLIMTFTATFSP